MSGLANRLWAKGFKPNLGEPWTLADHKRIDEFRAEIERLEADYKRLYEKHNGVGKEYGELLLENERLRAELERIHQYRAHKYAQNEQGHYCSFRSALDGCQDIANNALKGEKG